jgi:hypothetical protein
MDRMISGILVMFLTRAKDIYLLQSIHTGLGRCPAYYFMCKTHSFPQVKAI